MALLAALGLAVAGAFVYALESSRLIRDVNQQIEQEQQEFVRLQEEGIDPATGVRFDDVHSLLVTFLARNVPGDHEMLVAYQPGRPLERSPSPLGDGPLRSTQILNSLETLAVTGGTTKLETSEFGEVWVTALPVRLSDGSDTGALGVLNFLDEEYADLNQTMTTYALVGALTLLVITGLAVWQSGRLLAPLRVLRATTEEIGATDLSRRLPVTGSDDLTALTVTVNGMLARLETAFDDQRRFLDDAGHELRTPVTVLRGHLELLNASDPDDVAQTRELLLDEVDRMSRLVDDLITLAKARRPDFVRPEPVSLAELTESIFAKAGALGERAWRLEAVAGGEVRLDPQRITQAVLQLAENAVKHTDPGAVVALGSERRPGRVVIWVRDEGDGVPADQRETIFERFGRATVREGDPGFGLGLSLVAAIAEGHGGEVVLTPGSSSGSAFALVLPVDAEPGGFTWHAS